MVLLILKSCVHLLEETISCVVCSEGGIQHFVSYTLYPTVFRGNTTQVMPPKLIYYVSVLLIMEY